MSRLSIFICLILLFPAAAWAQGPGGDAYLKLPLLSGPQRKALLLIAREAVDATLETRASRAATVDGRLRVPQPAVISLYVNGELRSRSWRLKPDRPLYLDVRDLTYEAINRPRDKDDSLTPAELAGAQIGLAVLSGYTRVQDDREVPPRSAVIVLSGFTEAVGLPGDVDSDSVADLLSHACERAGLRPHVWLLPQTTIFYAQVDGTREESAKR